MKDTRKLSTLHGWKDNPRNITTKDYERLKLQIKKLGQYKPILVTKDGEVIGGNMRLKAYQELGITDIWVSEVNPKDDNEKLEYALSDNDRAGYYDDDLLANLIPNYDIDWSQYAVDMKPPEDIQALIDRIAPVEEDEAPEVEQGEVVSKLGEVYQLGRHRLMCGDSTKIEDVEKLMDGKKSEISFTSPPYNAGKTPTEEKMGLEKKYENYDDNKSKSEYLELLVDSTLLSLNFSEFSFVNLQSIAGNKIALIEFLYQMKEKYADTLIWDKCQAQPAMAYNVLNSRYEYIHVFSNKATRAIGTKVFRGNVSNIIQISKQNNNETKNHHATFPVEFAAFFVNNFCEQSVLDLFGGSGSTLIACEQTNRICYMMELDPKYCDVIRKRYAKFIGKEESWEITTPAL